MTALVAAFHFLRPWWLLALPVLLLVWWSTRQRAANGSAGIAAAVAPHLRAALTVEREKRRRFQPIDLLATGLACLAVAAAGPTWNQLPSPWLSETAPLVVALEVSRSMLSNDVQPTRLDRARFAIQDLIERRGGARTALIAYAKSAHIVLPPTRDSEVFKLFLEGLTPDVMPDDGENASAAVEAARRLLGDEPRGSTLLLVGDGFDPIDLPAMAELADAESAPAVVALIFGSESGGVALMPDGSAATDGAGKRVDTRVDSAVLDQFADQVGPVVRATADDSDVRRLLWRIDSRVEEAAADDPDVRWRDQGWWFVWPAALIAAAWFRRGWTMQW